MSGINVNQTVAKMKKLLGQQMYQADLLRPNGNGTYVWIKSLFVEKGDKILAPGKPKGEAWEIHLDNVHEFKRNVGIMKLNSENGRPISTGDGATVSYPPKVLHRLMGVEHVAGAVRSAKRGDTNLIMCLLCFGIGALLGAMIMMGLPAFQEVLGVGKPQNFTLARPLVEYFVKP